MLLTLPKGQLNGSRPKIAALAHIQEAVTDAAQASSHSAMWNRGVPAISVPTCPRIRHTTLASNLPKMVTSNVNHNMDLHPSCHVDQPLTTTRLMQQLLHELAKWPPPWLENMVITLASNAAATQTSSMTTN